MIMNEIKEEETKNSWVVHTKKQRMSFKLLKVIRIPLQKKL